ncbi:uncharacterized protein LTR77_009106 [Saxophila tyrrhenica]|uniref:Uncharacterized protein n=1 Tax=Saxophila tyrrhenica TaxID=1690608 RepID=A0AAV9P3H8_9PEZI|nr:hypothetical protein LTR77_009106 [Saxophila tyrrhenica]
MARFYPLYVRRSDGKREVLAKGKRSETNQPTDEQLDQKPDRNGISDYYREVGIDESKHLDWRRKLGGMLARELVWKDKEAQQDSDAGYMLVALPENYRLYEHVKKTVKDGKTEIKSKTHAGGGNDRQDAYLYGHPAGRKKRYRSPGDFFPHLLWLCTDEGGDPDNCGCKICSPEDLDDVVPNTKPKATTPTFKVEAGASGTGMMRLGSAQGTTKLKQEAGGPVPVQQRTLTPTRLEPAKSTDQTIDRQYNSFFYRPGEVVWFSRGAAWGIGVVLRRWKNKDGQNHYSVQPLSHPFGHPSAMTKTSDSELRPWLAWSVPKYTNDGLNQLVEPARYDNVDWAGLMMHKKYGTGDAEVDASILAAKSVDASYTPFASVRTAELESGVTVENYAGMYLGAEKLWVGDALRLQPGTDILVLHNIMVRRTTTSQELQQQTVHLIGDVYTIQRVQHTNPSTPTFASAQNNPQLPPRLTEDLAFRNNLSIRAKGTAHYWKLTAINSRHELNDIKGRWYEASLALPIVAQPQFEDAARKGEISEATLWMNSRGDCIGANRAAHLPRLPRQNVYRPTRREAFMQSIPPNAEIRDGVDPPLPDNVDPALEGLGGTQDSMDIDPRFDTADAQNMSSDEIRVSRPGEMQDQVPDTAGLDEFMNLEGMDEQGGSDLPGFGQHYTQENTQQGYY